MVKRVWLPLMAAVFIYTALPASPAKAREEFVPPNDAMRIKQTYLDQIHAEEAWAAAPANPNPIIVALVDTGVDVKHPDLAGRLVTGVNLLDPIRPPTDDNGHGTNVAGIIAAVPNNDKGITGIAWNAKIMPIKALESDGTGDEVKLGEGIRYAVDHGAKIVVLSLGLNKYSAYMSDIVQYAEDHDVLLVAATGNEGSSVKYPAAYPSVLAVGGATAVNHADYRSNYGPEVDIVAPWDVFTTAKGGGYEYKSGTSMAAPQAAAVAAMAWSKYPWMKPYQIRNLLYQTAQDLDAPGWDPYTGYGLLRADRAMTQTYREDMYEPNDRISLAKPLSVSTMTNAEFSSGQDQDWFVIDSPYDGTVSLRIDTSDGSSAAVNRTNSQGAFIGSDRADSGKPVLFPVTRGKNYIQLQMQNRQSRTGISYKLTTQFQIYRDPFEPNDKQYEAFVLPAQSQIVKGTFDHSGDQDWYMMHIEKSGKLRLRLSVDTTRIDPVLLVQRKGEKSAVYDQAGDGADETAALDVFPGDYYFRISNVKEYANPVNGEYTFSINYTSTWIDPNEPNNKPYQATFISPDTDYIGVFDNDRDVDWFQFSVDDESLAEIRLTGIPGNRTVSMTLLDSSLNELWSSSSVRSSDDAILSLDRHLTSGTYYIKLQSDQSFSDQPYHLLVSAYPIVAGYIDIAGHWAKDAVVELTRQDIVNGYGSYLFRPDKTITRAEAAVVLVRAFKLTKERTLRYPDVPWNHWAYSFIAKAEQNGIMGGYPDGTFAPDEPITRMEMVSMLAKSLHLAGKKRGGLPFADVDEDYWGVGILKQMKADGWITGFPDGTFRPEQYATRAEFVTILEKILKR